MSNLVTLNSLNIANFVSVLRDSVITVYENVQGSKLYFNCDGREIHVKARSLNTEPLNQVDYAMQKYFQPVFDYLDALDSRVKKLLPKDWWFCVEYFFDTKPCHVTYDYTPTNGLMLTGIFKRGENITTSVAEIEEYADLLGIDFRPSIFRGKLSDKQIEIITYFLSTAPGDLELIFDEENFASFFYKILNPQLKNSVLMKDGQFQDNLDKLIIQAEGEDVMAFSLLNPLYTKFQNDKAVHSDVYSILLMDFLEFTQLNDWSKVPVSANEQGGMYLQIMGELFNRYCKERQQKVIKFEFNVPPFFQEDKYKINIEMVEDALTKYYLNKSEKLEYLFKIVLTAFRTYRKKGIGVLNDKSVSILNQTIDQINALIDKKMKVSRDLSLKADNLLDFDNFFNITYPKDADDKVYPDLYKELEEEPFINTKKKKGGMKGMKGFTPGNMPTAKLPTTKPAK